jgi:hypothetical protein
VEIRYTAQRKDVGALLRYNLQHSVRLWVILAAVALFPAGIASVAGLVGGRRPRSGDIMFDLILGAVLVAVMLLRARARTKSDERVLSIGAEGIHTEIGERSADLPWRRITPVDVTSEYIFITGKNSNGFVIPSRAFASPVERAEFVNEVEAFRNHGAPRTVR